MFLWKEQTLLVMFDLSGMGSDLNKPFRHSSEGKQLSVVCSVEVCEA